MTFALCIIEEAQAHGVLIARLVGDHYVIDRAPFDLKGAEYQIVTPLIGG